MWEQVVRHLAAINADHPDYRPSWGTKTMTSVGYAQHAMAEFQRRTGRPPEMSLDAYYQFETAVLRDMLTRLEVILQDEGVDQAVTERVIRCMLYGSPSPAAAEQRMRQEAEMVKLVSRLPPEPLFGPFSAPGEKR